MSAWSGKITVKGLALQAKLVAGESFNITKAMSAAGKVPIGDLESQTELNSPVQKLDIEPVQVSSETKTAEVPVVLTNLLITSAYTAHQIGIYADDPDEGEILYCILQNEDGENIPASEQSLGFGISWTVTLSYGNADSVTVLVDGASYVTHAQLEDKLKNYDPAGSAEAVKQNLTAHTSDKSNPHEVTCEQIGAAPESHTHDVSDITSGILPVPRGGTGLGTLTAGYPLFGNGTSAVSPTTPLNAAKMLGRAYGTCSTAAATVAKTVTAANFVLNTGAIVFVKFTNAVPAGSTLNVNSTGTKEIYYAGEAIKDNAISTGDTGLFVYNGTQWDLMCVNKEAVKIATGSYTGTGTYGSANPVVLNVGFKIKYLYIMTSGGSLQYRIISTNETQADFGRLVISTIDARYTNAGVTITSTGVSFYSSIGNAWAPWYQCNAPNATYSYVAIG